mgnify:FL=1
MANRYVSFGYEITDGKYAVIENEKKIVENIFGLYLNGKSFSEISDRMNEAGVPYNNDGRLWNKNMIKRVIENRRYIGEKGFPQIIADDTFNAAEKIRLSKFTAPGETRKALLDFYREHLVCGRCGMNLRRYTCGRYIGNKIVSYRKCQNELCNESKSSVNEDILDLAVSKVLNDLIDDYKKIEGVNETEPKQNIEIARLESELADDMEKMTVDIEKAVQKITELAEARFNNAPECDYSAIDERIKKELSIHPKSETPDSKLLEDTVKRIAYLSNGTVEIELINGYKVSGGERK